MISIFQSTGIITERILLSIISRTRGGSCTEMGGLHEREEYLI